MDRPQKKQTKPELPKKKPSIQRGKHPNKSVQTAISKDETTAQPQLTSWNKVAVFCDESYQNLIPQSYKHQRDQTPAKDIHQKCVEIIMEDDSNNWENIVTQNFTDSEYRIANHFYFKLSNRYRESPKEFRQNVTANLQRFVELADCALTETTNRDFVKITEFVDIINSFSNSSEQTYFFLSKLPSVVDENARKILLDSVGYQTMLKWGASLFIRKFGLQLQRKFRLTYTAIKDEAAQNLARELGETEKVLKNQIEQLVQENESLKTAFENSRAESSSTAIYNLAKLLQNQAQPVLDQVFTLHQKLVTMSEMSDGLSVTASEALSILITLESLLEGFQELNITYFPKNTSKPFELYGNQLGEYSYIEGSAFTNAKDKKIVRCVFPGWRVGKEIVTPARVKEFTDFGF